MIKNREIVVAIYIILISTKVICGQPASSNIANNRFTLTAYDTLGQLKIPKRLENAISGSEFVNQVIDLNIIDREKAIVREILSGNVPSFTRKLKPLKITKVVNGKSYEVIFFATYDYIAIGSDDDYLYIPMTPSTAQYLADNINCILPTKEIVDIIYSQAEVKLKPQPIPPSNTMTTVPVFKQHTDSIKHQIMQIRLDRSNDNIIAGHKKDIIISNKIYSGDRTFDSVVIYGWHLDKNTPIQPVFNGHNALYADYSHGLRFISKLALINGESILIENILKNQNLSILLSNEGVISKPYYPANDVLAKAEKRF